MGDGADPLLTAEPAPCVTPAHEPVPSEDLHHVSALTVATASPAATSPGASGLKEFLRNIFPFVHQEQKPF